MQVIYCVLVGDKGVAKTSLLIFYTTNSWPVDNDNIPDVFDDYSANIMLDGHPLHLYLVDTPSGDEYLSKRISQYSRAHVIMLCFDIGNRDTFNKQRLINWKNEIREYCKDQPIILVGNKVDFKKRFL